MTTQLIKYIKTIITDKYAMNVLYYCIRRVVADYDFDLKDVTVVKIDGRFLNQEISININHRFNNRQKTLSLLMSIRALMLHPKLISKCNDDFLLFYPSIYAEYKWVEYYSIIRSCDDDKDFAFSLKLLSKANAGDFTIVGEEEDEFEEYTIEPEPKNLKNYYICKARDNRYIKDEVICNYAFLCNEKLNSYTISNKIKYVGNSAFAFCPNLKRIIIQGKDVQFGKFPVIECNVLEAIVVPEGRVDYYCQELPYYKNIIIDSAQKETDTVEEGSKNISLSESEDNVQADGAPSESIEGSNESMISVETPLVDFYDENLNRDELRKALLTETFHKKTTTYKYFWFLTILKIIDQKGCDYAIPIEDIVKEMPILAMEYVVAHGSFPLADILPLIVKDLINNGINKCSNEEECIDFVDRRISENNNLSGKINNLSKNVTYRFLSPWIKFTSNSDVTKRSMQYENDCPYSISKNYIKVNPDWYVFLEHNMESLIENIERELHTYLQLDDFVCNSNEKQDDEWYFIDNVKFEIASEYFWDEECRVVLADKGYYLELSGEFIKLGDYPQGFNDTKGNIWIMSPISLNGMHGQKIMHVNSAATNFVGFISKDDQYITFTTPDGEDKLIEL